MLQTSKEIFFSNSAKLQHIFKINSDKHGIRWTFVEWNWRWKIPLKLDVLQANGYVIEIKAKGTNWRGNSGLWADIETKLK